MKDSSCSSCHGAGWTLHATERNLAERCRCNPGEPIRSWTGGVFGEPQYPKRNVDGARDFSEPA